MNDQPRLICGARNRTGNACQLAPSIGRRRCRFHGGATPIGPASGTWIDGRHSRYLPKRLADRFEASLTDPELLSLASDVALLDARAEDLLRRVDSGESGRTWEKLRAARGALVAAGKRDDHPAASLALSEILHLIDRGSQDTAAWAELREVLQDRRRLVLAESRRLHDRHNSVSVDQFVATLNFIAGVITTYVTDVRTRRLIVQEIATLTVLPGGRLDDAEPIDADSADAMPRDTAGA